jgi:predicted transcriptional regulator
MVAPPDNADLMKRISVTLDDDLEFALENYILSQEAKPSLTAVVQAALEQFLHRKGIAMPASKGRRQAERGAPKQPKKLTAPRDPLPR